MNQGVFIRVGMCVGAALSVGVLAACGSSESSSSSNAAATNSSGTQSVAGKRVIVSSCGSANPFCGAINQQLVGDLKSAGLKVTLLENNLDPTVQSQQLNQAIGQRPDALVVLETDTTSAVAATRKAMQAGIKVVNIDGRADPAAIDDLALQVVTDNPALGRFAAQNIVAGLKAQGRKRANVIAITGTQSSLTVQDRMKAFKDELAKTPQYKLVAVQDAQWNPVATGKIASQLFGQWRSKGNIQAAYGMADYMAVAIVQAAKQAGMRVGGKDGVVITGSNCNKAGIKAIEAGDMFGTGTQRPGVEGAAAAKHTIDLLAGKTLPKTIVLPEHRITKANVSQYAADCSKS